MTSLVMPICMYCTHYRRGDLGHGYRCTAFPDGIPEAIIQSQVDHREAVAGDHGLRLSPTEKRGAAYAAELFGVEGAKESLAADVAG